MRPALRSLLACLLLATMPASWADDEQDTRRKLSALGSELKQLRKLGEEFRQERSELQRELRQAETSIGKLNRQIRGINRELRTQQRELRELQQRRGELQQQRQQQQHRHGDAARNVGARPVVSVHDHDEADDQRRPEQEQPDLDGHRIPVQ